MKTNTQKIQVPEKDPLTAADIASALNITTEAVGHLILEGKFGAVDIARDSVRRSAYRIPLKSFIQYINGNRCADLFFKFPAANMLPVSCLAKAMSCAPEHVYHLLKDKEFPNAVNLATKGAARAAWRVPLCDFVAFINRRREGCYE